MHPKILYLLLAFWTALPCLEAAAAGSISDETPATGGERIRMVRSNNDFAPFEFLNANGQPDGFTVELMREVARAVGLTIDLQMGTWADVLDELKTGRIDALTGVLFSPERDRFLDFSVPHTVLSYSVFVRRNSGIEVNSLNDLEDRQILIVRGVYAQEALQKRLHHADVLTVDTPEEALRRVSSGRYEMTVLVRLNGLELMRRLGIDNLQTIGPPVLTQKFCMAVREGDAALLAKINEGLYRLQADGIYDRIYLKWFSVHEQKQLLERLQGLAKLALLPLLGLALAAGLWIWALQHTVKRRTGDLRSSQDRFRRILESTPLATVVVDSDGCVSHWNPACQTLTGIRADQVVDRSRFCRPQSQDQRPALVRILEDSAAAHKAAPAVTRRLRPAFEIDELQHLEVYVPFLGPAGRWLYGILAPYRNAEGQATGAIETWADLTDRRELENQLVHARKMESLGKMAQAVAHDFSSYLQVILGYSFSLRQDLPETSDSLPDLKGIDDAVYKAKQLISQIMTFASRNLTTPRPVHVRTVVADTLEMTMASLPPEVTLHRRLESEAWILADPVQIGRVVMNLCTNAVQAMSASGGRLEVRLGDAFFEPDAFTGGGPAPAGDCIRLTVTDSGPGISAENREHIFEPFYTTRRKEGGSGMGLAIVHGIVYGYGGHITVDTREERGTTFEVIWPTVGAPGRDKEESKSPSSERDATASEDGDPQ
jgi:signal transduction histidine kinase/ABC-type amino acid transport substrate-binding protein